MAAESRIWPVVLFAGICVAMLVGVGVALAAPAATGRPSWHDDGPQRITGTVVELDADAGELVLDGLVSYNPLRAGIGRLVIHVADDVAAAVGDTVDVIVTRADGRWWADAVIVLDPD